MEKRQGEGLSETVLVCAAAGNCELILLFSYYNIYFREITPLDLCSVVFTYSVGVLTTLLYLVTGQRYLMMSCRAFRKMTT